MLLGQETENAYAITYCPCPLWPHKTEGHNTRDDISVWYCWPQGWVWQKRAAGRRHGQRVVDSAPPTNPIHLLRWQLPILPSDSQLILWSSRHSGSRKQGTRFARCFNDLFDTACLEEGHSLLVSSQLVVQGKQLPNALSYTFGSVPESVVIAWHSFEVRRRTEPSILIMLKNKKINAVGLAVWSYQGKDRCLFQRMAQIVSSFTLCGKCFIINCAHRIVLHRSSDDIYIPHCMCFRSKIVFFCCCCL